jgi:hypothetical protein
MLNKTFTFDKYLNLILGFVLLFFPNLLKSFIFAYGLFPTLYLKLLGVGLFLFGIWQEFLAQKDGLQPNVLKILSFAALLPVLVLTVWLIFNFILLTFFGKAALIIADLYMLWLGILYCKYSKI